MEEVRKLIHQLIQKYHICRCYIDQSLAVLIRQLCKDYGETIRYDLIDEKTRDQLLSGTDCRRPLINAVNFRTYHKKLAERLHQIVSTHQIRIDPVKFPLTVMSLRTVINKPGDIWDIDKQQTSHSDVFYALRMCTLCLRSNN
jgi:hypothetical protein